MEINKDIYLSNGINIKRADKSKSAPEERPAKDIANSPNPAEYIGRSQVIFRGKTPETEPAKEEKLPHIDKKDIPEIQLTKTPPLSKKEAKNYLKEFGFNDDDLSKIDFDDEKILSGVGGMKAFFEADGIKEDEKEAIESFKKSSQEEKLEFIENEIKDDALSYLNKENFSKLHQFIDFDNENAWEVVSPLVEEENKDLLKAIPLIAYSQGMIDGHDIRRLSYSTDYNNINYERADIIRKINNNLPENSRLPAIQANHLGADEELTPDAVDKYVGLLEKYQKNKNFDINTFLPSYNEEPISKLNEDISKIDDVLEKYPINFDVAEKDSKFSKQELEQITNRQDIDSVQQFLNALTPEAKRTGIKHMPDSTSTIDRAKLAHICNTIKDKDYGRISEERLFNFLDRQKENGYQNLDNIIKLIDRYKGTGELNCVDMNKAFTFGHDDFGGAITALDLKDEIQNKNLHLDNYYFDEALHNPDTDFNEFNKILTAVKNGEVDGNDIPARYYTDPKGYNKLFLYNKRGYYSDDYRKKLDTLAETLNSDDELHFANDLFEQKRYLSPDYSDGSSRFDYRIEDIQEIMDYYQTDKVLTEQVVNMKDSSGEWRFSSKDNIIPAIQSYKINKELTQELVDLKTDSGRARFNGKDIKPALEAAMIDKDYTLELINKKDKFSSRQNYRFKAEDLPTLVNCAQKDKDFMNYLMELNYTDRNYGVQYYLIRKPEDFAYLIEKSGQDKEFVSSLLNMKTKNYDGSESPKFDIYGLKIILDNPPENKEFLLDIINKKKMEYGHERDVYSPSDVVNIAEAANIDKELTQRLLNETITVSGYKEKEQYKRFNSLYDIKEIVKNSQIDKDFAIELLNETTKDYKDDILPRYKADDISGLLKLSEKYDKNLIKTYLNMTTASFVDDRQAPRFSASDIATILKFREQNPQLLDKLINTKTIDSKGIERAEYNMGSIYSMSEAVNIDSGFAQQLFENNNNLPDSLKLSGDSILFLTRAAQVDKDMTLKLLDMKYLTDNGKQRYRFDSYDIYNAVNSGTKDINSIKELAQMTKIGRNNNKSFRFDACEITLLSKLLEKEPDYTKELISLHTDNDKYILSAADIKDLVEDTSFDDYKILKQKIGDDINHCNADDITTAIQFKDLYGVENLNDIPLKLKKEVLKTLVSTNSNLFNTSDIIKQYFPLIPKSAEEYCQTLPALVRSIGIETNELDKKDVEKFNKNMNDLSTTLKDMSDEDFNNLEVDQSYKKDDFIKDVLDKLESSNLSNKERQRVFDYYGFELHKNPNNPTGYAITGYPVNLNNGKKLAEIKDPETKKVVEDLRKNVIEFSQDNKIYSNNKKVQNLLNDIVDVLPEMRTTIGKREDDNHDFDIMKHSLKVMQKITQNPDFDKLNDSDKKVMLLASLMHNLSKTEGFEDVTTPNESSFDSFFISKKFNLTKDENIKLYTLIKSQNWVDDIAGSNSDESAVKAKQSIAFDLQQNNNFDMAEIFAKANTETLKTAKEDKLNLIETVTPEIKEFVAELKKSQPLLPQTKMPKASTIEKAITYVNDDGSTNIKGVYKDKSGLVVVKFNEVDDWEKLGLPKSSTNKGIKAKAVENIHGEKKESETETGNIKFFVHGLDYPNQLAKFDAFSLVNSDVLLSVSYAERPETKYRFYRPQGVMLDVPSDYVYGGGNTDSGSGCGKFIDQFKNNYVFGGYRECDRKYIPDLIKEETGMSDDEYAKFVEKNKDKSITEIEPKELQERIVKKLATINSNHRKGNRAYNEMYISNPKKVTGVFAYEMDDDKTIDDPLKFLKENDHRTGFLQKYAIEHDVPFYVFGD